MKYNPDIHHRRSIRLKDYDYSSVGAYFVTICVQNRELLLNPTPVRNMIEKWWCKLPEKFPTIEIDEFVVMPNHIHGIIIIVGATPCGRPDKGHPHGDAPTLGDIIDWFKTMTTNEYIRNVKSNGWKPFPGRLWQRNYYEHIIRNEFEMNRIREYIGNNLLNWENDKYFTEA